MKLHIGCADVKIDGYVNIDARKTRATDLVANAWELGSIAGGSVEEIYTRHTIEHLEPDEARQSFKEWMRVLVPGGFAHIVCPDLVFHARQLLGMAHCPNMHDQELHALFGFYGWRDPDRGGSRYDAHRWGYTPESLIFALKQQGFARFDKVSSGKDSEAWHINIKAYKHNMDY